MTAPPDQSAPFAGRRLPVHISPDRLRAVIAHYRRLLNEPGKDRPPAEYSRAVIAEAEARLVARSGREAA